EQTLLHLSILTEVFCTYIPSEGAAIRTTCTSDCAAPWPIIYQNRHRKQQLHGVQ
ncbi:hypothetical protein HispidOSU_021618, partial [Sigmodon hispidus]